MARLREVRVTGHLALHDLTPSREQDLSETTPRRVLRPGQDDLPLALLHGFLGSSGEWADVCRAMRRQRRVWAIDLPGHGHQPHRKKQSFSLEGAAKAVLETLDAQGAGRFVLAGYSMGGRIAMHVARAAPDRVAGLAVLAAHPGLTDPDEKAQRHALDTRRAQELTTDFDGFLRRWFESPLFRTMPPAAAGALIRARLEGDQEALAEMLVGASTGTQDDMRPVLLGLGCPVLLLAGGLDPGYVGLLSELAATHSGPRLVVVPGVGHNLLAEGPLAVAAELDRFPDSRNDVLR